MAPTGEPESCSKCLSSWQTFLKKFRFLSIINVFQPFCSSIVRQKRHRNWIPIKNARQQRRGTFNVYVCNKHSPFAELAVARCLMPITNSDTRLLPWQFLYTACTRAQKPCSSSRKNGALAAGAETETINHGVTRLQERLQNQWKKQMTTHRSVVSQLLFFGPKSWFWGENAWAYCEYPPSCIWAYCESGPKWEISVFFV